MLPCQKRLDADCFRNNPAWAKQAFAYRLVHLLTPKQLTRRLPKFLRAALIAAGVVVPPGLVLPAGTLVAPGTVLPPVWSPGDPVPAGITVPTGTVFPPGWSPGDPEPDGVTLDPGSAFPPDWTPPDPVPDGLYPTPQVPPETVATGPAPPTYVAPAISEPTAQVGRISLPTGATLLTLTSSIKDGTITASDATWATVRDNQGNAYAWDTTETESQAMTSRLYNAKYYIRRSFLYFDLSSIPTGSTILSVTIGVVGYYYAHTDVAIQEGTQHDTLEDADWLAFTGTYFAKLTWQKRDLPTLNTNLFVLNAAGIQYVEDQIGNTAKFCLRAYDYDYLDVAPPDTDRKNGCCFADYPGTTYDPHIIIEYE